MRVEPETSNKNHMKLLKLNIKLLVLQQIEYGHQHTSRMLKP